MGHRGRRYFAPDGGRDGEVAGTEIFAYGPLGHCSPGIADSCDIGCAEAACAPVYARCGAVVVVVVVVDET